MNEIAEVKNDSVNNELTLTMENGQVFVFHSRAELVSQFPEHERFADGMGWT